MKLRTRNLARLEESVLDVLVVGGGINGAVSASALSARGASVGLIDRGDFAGFTSQESSNLAWGGIKYMESYEFGLVSKLCASRNRLISAYPSTVREIRFLATHTKDNRHGLLTLVMGTFFYWVLGRFFTRAPRYYSREGLKRAEPRLNLEGVDGGFEYSDAYLHDNDARFVFGFIRAAMDHGAIATNYVEATSATRKDDVWHVGVRDKQSGRAFEVRAKHLVNACGPFVDGLGALLGTKSRHRHAFSKGIHLIVPRISEAHRVLAFFADDGRLFFVIPMGPCTCIGTTDSRENTPWTRVTEEDRAFVLSNINKRLNLERPLTTEDIIAERCGVRPLVVDSAAGDGGDWFQLSRKHVIESDRGAGYVAIFGGKLTDCLNVGDEVCEALVQMGLPLPYRSRTWYGEPPPVVRDAFMHQAARMGLDERKHPRSSERLSTRLWRRYGRMAFSLLESIRQDPREADVLIEGAEYLRCEIEHAARYEMVTKLSDFLRRRSKIALVISPEEVTHAKGLMEACRILFGDEADAKLEEYVAEGLSRTPAPKATIAESPNLQTAP